MQNKDSIKLAFIYNKKGVKTGASYINDLIYSKLLRTGIKIKSFYPNIVLNFPGNLAGLKNILLFYSLIIQAKKVIKFDMVQGTTFTPLPFLAYQIPVISHFGSTTKGFLDSTPEKIKEKELKNILNNLIKAKVLSEIDYKSRRPLKDIAEIEKYVASKASAIIASSLNVKKELLSMGTDNKRVYLIHNAIEDYWFNRKKSDLTNNPAIIFLGRMGNDAFNLKLKGVDRLIQLYQQFKTTPKTIVGLTDNDKLASWLKSNIENVSLFINVQKNKIPNILSKQRGSILFLPSRYEGFSLSLIEGMSQGLVPISYPVGVAPEIIKNGKNGFIVKNQKEAIKKMGLLLSNRKLRESCTKNAEKTAAIFTGLKMANEMREIYKKLKK